MTSSTLTSSRVILFVARLTNCSINNLRSGTPSIVNGAMKVLLRIISTFLTVLSMSLNNMDDTRTVLLRRSRRILSILLLLPTITSFLRTFLSSSNGLMRSFNIVFCCLSNFHSRSLCCRVYGLQASTFRRSTTRMFLSSVRNNERCLFPNFTNGLLSMSLIRLPITVTRRCHSR